MKSSRSLLTRRDFLRYAFRATLAVLLPSWLGACKAREERPPAPTPTSTRALPSPTVVPSPAPTASPTPGPLPKAAEIALAKGERTKDYSAITRAAIEAIGGMSAFVKPGDTVMVKPNICMAGRAPQYAATTHPLVVATIVQLCWEAGAAKVIVFDLPFSGGQKRAYEDSGIAQAVKGLDADLLFASPRHYEKVPFPQGRDIKSWPVHRMALEADVFINVPIAKHHSLAGLTLGMKNVMGVIQDRPLIHLNIHQRIADLNTVIKSHLVVMDATRILIAHGPKGGRLEDVRTLDTVIASTDIVAVDALAATLFGKKGSDIGYIQLGADMGLGKLHRPLKEVRL